MTERSSFNAMFINFWDPRSMESGKKNRGETVHEGYNTPSEIN